MDVAYIEKYHLTNRQLFMKALWRDLYEVSFKTGHFSSKEKSVLLSVYTLTGNSTRTIFGLISLLFESYFRFRMETDEGVGEIWFTSPADNFPSFEFSLFEERVYQLAQSTERHD